MTKEISKTEKKARNLKSFTDVFGQGDFYADLPKIDFKDLVTSGKQLILEDAKILKDFHTELGTHDCALMMFSEVENEENKFTTINSGLVIVERIKQALANRRLPLMATPVMVQGARSSYYNLI